MPTAPANTRFPLTEAAIRKWPAPDAGRVRLKDTGCPGLCIYITPGARTFYFYGKDHGRPVEVRLGVWPTMTVELARKQARSIAPAPAAAQQAKRMGRQCLTLAEAWQALLDAPYRQKDGRALRPATLASYRESWLLLTPLHGRKLDTFERTEVAALRHKLEKDHGASATRRTLALLSRLLPNGLPSDPRNRRATLLPHVAPRERFLEGWELASLLRGLDAEPAIWRMFWICTLVAPLRRGNLAAARWSEVHLNESGRERWEVPGDRSKNWKPLNLPIATPLANLLRDWRKEIPDSEWVFPASATASVKEGSTHIVNPLHSWKRALLLGSAYRMCEAIADAEGRTVATAWAGFRSDLDHERASSWSARGRPGAGVRVLKSKPLDRCVARLADRCRALKLAADAMQLRNLKPHDMRRTAGSWAVQGGASMAIVAAALGHSDQRVTQQHYGHLNDAAVRGLMNSNAGRILGMVEDKP
jgi:integrase